ncbi:hypothetical protein [Microbacterium hydrocarbonoxydans]|uniref:hypothetical protein n=1 Tax=Microbacterium hydrocarbonoxydans TaxID=273678 RepID=UPI0007BAE2FD|nr:hypothetical protein [Microbacterium hydrocarbonoxydans]GAT74680.1 elongator complex protein [Microbacterium sp. HM58-2]
MNTRPVVRAVALGALVIPTALLATGCTGLYNQIVHKEVDLTFEDRQALEDGWDRDAAWVPADATGITGTASTDSAVAAILLRSDEELDPAVCAETARASAPVYALDGAPDVFAMDTVYACGDWTVVAADDGWLGWTPSNPAEKAASPGS